MPGDYMTKPCPECPFLRGERAVRLTLGRIQEIAGNMLSSSGGEFHCHKTSRQTGDGSQRHCAGALIFAEKNGNATQMMRIAERLGFYDRTKLEGEDLVFDDLEEMEASALDRDRPIRRKRARR
jgi:hypothetical protein